LQKLETYLRDMCPDEIDSHSVKSHQKISRELGEIGGFGIKVPKKYGGLRFVACNYGGPQFCLGVGMERRAACSAHHRSESRTVAPVGTEEQKQKYLPASRRKISALH